jgi:thymidylate synthase (FAD)
MKPIKAKDLLELDKNLEVVMLQCYALPEQVIYQAGKCDYSETPIHRQQIPKPSECGEWVVERLLSNEKGHWGPLEHPSITFSVSGYVHNVAMQARTHRVGVSFDVQSQRYTGKRVIKVASGELIQKMYSSFVLLDSIPIVMVKNMIGLRKIMMMN